MSRFVPTAFAVALLGAACQGPPPPTPPLQPRPVVEVARWIALDGETRLGELVLLEIRDPAGPLRFYRVEDAAGRLVGSATEAHRFSRRVPFRDEEEDIGVWRPERGVAVLFGRPEPVEMRPKPKEASAQRR